MMQKSRRAVLVAAALAACACMAGAQTANWPGKPIKFIVPVPPGGAADAMARLIADHLTGKLGQAVVVDNRAGAGSSIGMDVVAKAAPDGYTIGLGNVAANAINPAVRPQGYPFEPVKAFAPISLVGVTPLILVVNAEKVPARTVPEFISYLKSSGGKTPYGSSGAGSSLHVGMELFLQMTGTRAIHVPYKGSAPMETDLMGGQVLASMDAAATSWPQVQAGKLRALGISTKERAFFAPDVPPIADTVPGFEIKPWHGVVAPAGTPPAIVKRLSDEIQAYLRTPAAEQRLRDLGVVRVGSSAPEFAKVMDDEYEFYKKLVKQAGIHAE
ncbi:tripartite tricarboxylate transporter substrate binding protein [Ramlibacter sp. G-1-2-2]|uniref:Tripartite tricarboxylate transporter substrate binding protein n=1 Tax=Ramlibacter agri TaxID=2728837 RepID=A0A848HHR1_9BURK|nr:tripartite tricarboxylate transporter substrate binding protein [Ramlibacter agri]NML47228.1 tripartite tricarboxylate transporter substrate binding protein [Ramlibacter agri]